VNTQQLVAEGLTGVQSRDQYPKMEKAGQAITSSMSQFLQYSAENLRQTLDCAAVLFLMEERRGQLSLVAWTLQLPDRQYPPSLRPKPADTAASGQSDNSLDSRLDNGLAIKIEKRSGRRNLAVRALYGPERLPYLITDCSFEALRPLLDDSEINQLKNRLGIRQIVALPLYSKDGAPLGVMQLAFDRALDQDNLNYLTAIGQQIAHTILHKRHLDAMSVLERIILTMQSNMADENEVLQTIVDAVVHQLGYAGAMMATLEDGHALPLRAYAMDINQSLIQSLEKRAGQSLLSEDSVVYLDDPRYKENLSVRAVRGYKNHSERLLLSDHLYDLLRPFVNKPICDIMQRILSIRQVLALPFFQDGKVVGNLFVMSRYKQFTSDELIVLTSFGQQAAAGLHNARLYRRAEEQRQIAEMFGRMAFGATASIHKLRNQIGAARTYLYLLDSMSDIPAEKLRELLADVSLISGRLDQAADLLDSLHQPWRHIPDEPVNVNHCLLRALSEIFPLTTFKPIDAQVKTENDILVSLTLSSEMPMIETTADMLSEAFRIIIKNGAEALGGDRKTNSRYKQRRVLSVSTRYAADEQVVIIIKDSGKGIQPAHLSRIFDLGWSTKEGQGMGFGLFWTKDYVQGLSGTIEVESRVGEGTTFTLTFPATISWEHQTVRLGSVNLDD
jgi:signal transduction histidine kinase